MRTNHRPGPGNTNWGPGVVNTNLVPGPVNTFWGPGPVNTNWGPGPGAKQRAGGREIQIPSQMLLLNICDRSNKSKD